MTSAEESFLEGTFGCPVTNLYGSREVGHVGALCPEGSLHVNQESFFLDTGPAYSVQCPGELFVTPLFASPMPLIRYQIGDLAELSTDMCSCGRTLEVISRLDGRSTERFTTLAGREISSAFWNNMFAQDPGCLGVAGFQVVYRPDGGLTFRIARRESYSARTEEFVRDYLKSNLDAGIASDFEYVNEIFRAASGKFPLVVDRRGE